MQCKHIKSNFLSRLNLNTTDKAEFKEKYIALTESIKMPEGIVYVYEAEQSIPGLIG